MVEFENPAAFFLLLLIPLLYFLRYMKLFTDITFPLTLADWKGEVFSFHHNSRRIIRFFATLFGISSFVCLIVAYANPVAHNQKKIYTSRGRDIVFVVDTSPSMAAKDIAGMSRLDAAKKAIQTLAGENNGDCLGIVEMARDAAVVVPPTMDRTVFFTRLDSLRAGEMGDGTAIGMGLSCAAFHLEKSAAPRKAVVLISDGENNAGSINPHTAARFLESKHIALYVLGIGTKGYVPIEYVDPHTGHVYSGYMESEYDSQSLSLIAAAANGAFFNIETLNALSNAFTSVSKNESVVQSYIVKNYDTEYYTVLMLFAACFFALSWFIRRVILQEVL
ncbi:MAG: VWA domain-containing protein [Treponema sp.]|nr:VWA domain-containing protein [Treponema sp.]